MARSHQKPKDNLPQEKSRVYQYAVIISVVLIAVVLLLAKQTQNKNVGKLSTEIVLPAALEEGVIVNSPEMAVAETLEEKIDRLHADQQPIFVFFHSDDCYLCTEMMKVVDEVLPEYNDRVHLVDVNVYDEANRNLLMRAQVRAIPTQLFFDSNGEVTDTTGLMSTEQLRAALDQISGN